MNITLISTSVTLTVTLICFAIIIKTYWNASVGPLTIKRRAIIAAYSALSIYLCSYFVRDCNDETEIFCVTSMQCFTYYGESYLFACNIFSNGSLYRNRYVWLFYNLFPLALAIPPFAFCIYRRRLSLQKLHWINWCFPASSPYSGIYAYSFRSWFTCL